MSDALEGEVLAGEPSSTEVSVLGKPAWVKDDYASYDDLVASAGHEILLSETCGSYQGDIVYLLADGKRRGLLVVGYGSCSGCDALEAEHPYGSEKESPGAWSGVVALRDSMVKEIRWFDSATDLGRYLADDAARALQWPYHDSEVKAVLDRIRDACLVVDGEAATRALGSETKALKQ